MLTDDPRAKCTKIEEVFGRIVPGTTNVAILAVHRRFHVGHPESKLWVQVGYEDSAAQVEAAARLLGKAVERQVERGGAPLVQCSCGASVWWAVTVYDKSTPMDPEPHDEGCWVVDGQTENGAPKVRTPEPLLDEPDTPRFRTHWATCPNADQHRKRNR